MPAQPTSQPVLPAFVLALPGEVYQIDTGFQRDDFDAAYLLVHQGHAAFIDCGTNLAVPRLLAALDALGLTREAVDFVIPTHVHLDHAGGAGLLMQHLPRAQLWVHPRGLRHLVEPSALVQGALAVYGEQEMARSYGQVQPVAAERAHPTSDGLRLSLAGRELLFADTPGHARHHHCIWDQATRGWFTGDTFGLSYREFDQTGPDGETLAWVLPSSTPVQFEPEALDASIQRLLAADPQCMYLTHYGRVTDVPRLGRLLRELLAGMAALGRRLADAPDRHAALMGAQRELFVASLRTHGCRLAEDEIARLLTIDIELNAQGMAVWLDRLPRA